MFRDCFFEYAGRYSGDYNLIMAYVSDNNTDFIAGGKYEPSTDTLPMSAERLLYTLNYADNPIEFSVEIVNVDEAIPFEQMIEIKEWLFGQDGWKRLLLESADYKGYYLNCLLVPEYDIVDGYGYRGVRCTLKNVSGFWYRDEEITFTKDDFDNMTNSGEDNIDSDGCVTIDMDIKGSSPYYISPILNFQIPEYEGSQNSNYYNFVIHNSSQQYNDIYPDSEINSTFSTTYTGKNLLLNCKHCTLSGDGSPILLKLSNDTPQYDWFYLVKGKNTIKLKVKNVSNTYCPYLFFTIKYSAMYRIGGF